MNLQCNTKGFANHFFVVDGVVASSKTDNRCWDAHIESAYRLNHNGISKYWSKNLYSYHIQDHYTRDTPYHQVVSAETHTANRLESKQPHTWDIWRLIEGGGSLWPVPTAKPPVITTHQNDSARNGKIEKGKQTEGTNEKKPSDGACLRTQTVGVTDDDDRKKEK